MPSPRFQSESMLKSAFDKSKSTSFGKRATRSLMSVNSSVPRRSSSIASASLTTVRKLKSCVYVTVHCRGNYHPQSKEASHLKMESEDSLAVEIFQAKVSYDYF